MDHSELICRLPARNKRWRTWSPEDESIGPVPFQGAKWIWWGILLTPVLRQVNK
jgi:hypothetical protein